jgi:flagellar export protein FliJ
MKRFVWRLQRVLDVKTKQEEVKRIELFRLTETLAGKRSELLMRQRAMQDMLKRITQDTSPRRLMAQEFFLRQAATNDEQMRRLRNEIAELECQQKQKTSELLTVRRFKEGLERLRAQARERFLREQEKVEQKEMDERATMTFARVESEREREAVSKAADTGYKNRCDRECRQ